MSDRGWLLNHSAIIAAKACIHIVQDELGVKLKLSHPQFIEMLSEYCLLTESEVLQEACRHLLSFAGGQESMVALAGQHTVEPVATVDSSAKTISGHDSVEYQGKQYSRFDEQGREFQGLYRGGARYG